MHKYKNGHIEIEIDQRKASLVYSNPQKTEPPKTVNRVFGFQMVFG